MKNTLIYIIGLTLITSCISRAKLQKGFQVNNYEESSETSNINGINKDSLKFETRPGGVLLTGIPNVRVTSIFKVNYKKDKKTTFIGSYNFITKEKNTNIILTIPIFGITIFCRDLRLFTVIILLIFLITI